MKKIDPVADSKKPGEVPEPVPMETPSREVPVSHMRLDAYGREIPDPTPLAPPVGYVRRPTIAEQMRQMIQQASYEASQAGAETEEEANDFDDPDVEEWNSADEDEEFEIDPVYEQMIALQSRRPLPDAPLPATSSSNQPAPPSLTNE